MSWGAGALKTLGSLSKGYAAGGGGGLFGGIGHLMGGDETSRDFVGPHDKPFQTGQSLGQFVGSMRYPRSTAASGPGMRPYHLLQYLFNQSGQR